MGIVDGPSVIPARAKSALLSLSGAGRRQSSDSASASRKAPASLLQVWHPAGVPVVCMFLCRILAA